MDPDRFLASFDPRVAAFWSYWNSLPKNGRIPHLRDYLDRVPPDLQPSVVIGDFYSPDRHELRLIGTMMADAMGRDDPSPDFRSIYSAGLQRRALGITWAAANHPCGFAAKRPVRSRGGRTVTVAGVALPLTTDRPGCKTMLNFSNLTPIFDSFASDDHVQNVESHSAPIWLDIGCGVPETAQP